MKRILDPAFRYRPSYDTNVRETFERARREQAAARAARREPAAPQARIVSFGAARKTGAS